MENVLVARDVFYGLLGYEEKENSGTFLRKLVRLDTAACKLDLYPDTLSCETLRASIEPDKHFEICYMSMAADASSARPKVSHCFYIVFSGKKHYFKASNDKEKQTWISKLNDASRITVPEISDRQSVLDTSIEQTGFKVEVVGGVIVKTPMENMSETTEDADSDDGIIRSASPCQHVEEDAVKAGYCTKQGMFRKNWKRRYFILSSSSFRYCRSLEDKTPIRIVKLLDITEARPSVGIHLNREYVFEVVTSNRVFYIQADSESDRDAWITMINRCLTAARGPKGSPPVPETAKSE